MTGAMDHWIAWSFQEHHRRHRHCVSDEPHFVPSKYGGYFSCDQTAPLGEYDSVIRLVVPDFLFAREVPDTTSDTVFRLLFYREGVAFEHPCVVIDRELRISAPMMERGKKGHMVSYRNNGFRVTPSIVCTSCDLHGWVENGVWVPACPVGSVELDVRDIDLSDDELFELLEDGWI